jgi:hypothetical protein
MKKFLLTWAFGATLLAFVAGLVVTGSSASATPAYPPTGQCGLSVASSEIGPGSSVSLSGAGLSANKTYTLSSNGSAVGSARTNGSGNFSATVRLGSAASQTLSVAGSRCPNTVIHVVDAVHATKQVKQVKQTTKAVATAKSSMLASTGVRVAGLLTIGFALIGIGVAMMAVRRRSRA